MAAEHLDALSKVRHSVVLFRLAAGRGRGLSQKSVDRKRGAPLTSTNPSSDRTRRWNDFAAPLAFASPESSGRDDQSFNATILMASCRPTETPIYFLFLTLRVRRAIFLPEMLGCSIPRDWDLLHQSIWQPCGALEPVPGHPLFHSSRQAFGAPCLRATARPTSVPNR